MNERYVLYSDRSRRDRYRGGVKNRTRGRGSEVREFAPRQWAVMMKGQGTVVNDRLASGSESEMCVG
jgi:hypothetical protein